MKATWTLRYLEDGIDEERVCIGEYNSIDTDVTFEELDAAFHGGVLESDRVSMRIDRELTDAEGTHERDQTESVFDILFLYSTLLL